MTYELAPIHRSRPHENLVYRPAAGDPGLLESLQARAAVQRQPERESGSATDRLQILNQLNQVYAEEPSDLDPALRNMQFLSLPREDW